MYFVFIDSQYAKAFLSFLLPHHQGISACGQKINVTVVLSAFPFSTNLNVFYLIDLSVYPSPLLII
jgi:hypothetical protein